MLITSNSINMITHNKYVLASSSESRKKILNNCGFTFTQAKPLCDEETIKKKTKHPINPKQLAKKLSLEKAKSISLTKKHFNDYVIGCDTLIYFNNKIYDKAKSLDEARIKIKKLSGKNHQIISGLTVCKNGKKKWQCCVTTKVKIRKLTYSQIDRYLKLTGKQILNSVGCYQLEALGPTIIEDIKGDFFNVLGLPLFKLLNYLSNKK